MHPCIVCAPCAHAPGHHLAPHAPSMQAALMYLAYEQLERLDPKMKLASPAVHAVHAARWGALESTVGTSP